ncbi:MAG: SMC-Scp complex subunit ScpB [Acidobacteriota bacterium]|nr:SMC-Scp complex subunit ScpB [Acidobacteriota bacterium]
MEPAEPSEPEVQGPSDQLKATIEALIFASPEPMSLKMLCKLLDGEPKEDVQAALDEVRASYDRPGGLQFVEVAGGYQIVTRPELHEWVRRLFHERTTSKLSVAALETLAVIAYRQPVTAPEIADIRGVNTSGVLATLIDRKLVKIVGRKQVVGRPFMYGTTRDFLERFGLNDLTDLPKVEDMSELLGFELPGMSDTTPETGALPFEEHTEDRTQNAEEERAGEPQVGADAPDDDAASGETGEAGEDEPEKDVVH